MNLYWRVLRYLAPETSQMILTIVLGVLTSIFSVVSIYTILPLLDAVFNGGKTISTAPAKSVKPAAPPDWERFNTDKLKEEALEQFQTLMQGATREETLRNICLFLIITFLLKNVFLYLSNQVMFHIETKTAKKLRDDVFGKILSLQLDYFHRHRVGTLMQRVNNDVYTVQVNVSGSFINLVRNAILAACYLLVLLVISWKLTFFAFAVSILSLVIIRFVGKRVRVQADVIQDNSGMMNSRLQEIFNGVKLVKSSAMEEREAEGFGKLTDAYRRANLKIYSLRGVLSPLNETLGIAAIACVLWFGGVQVFQGSMSSAELVLFVFALYSVMNPIKTLAETNSRIQEGMSAAEKLFEILDTAPSIINGTKTLSRIERGITFQNVWFRYGDEYVLKNVSFEIPKGEMVALVGQSGSGKSTTVDLLLRFYDVERGAILIDGVNIKEFDVRSLRKLFGVVSQEVVLFNDTIERNIRYGDVDTASKERVIEAATIANAHTFISDTPRQYETFIGDRGVRLSGGQRQRLSIARAMLRNPPVLIFDEATSALDNESEKIVQEAIDNAMNHRTALVIAHRLSTIRNADNIIVLEKGEIKESGNHSDLVAHGGIYKRLYEMQFALEPSGENNAG